MDSDLRLLFTTRIVRLFAYGLISVILALYLEAIGLGKAQIGVLLSLTLAGDVLVSLPITLIADRSGRRRMLVAGATLVVFAGLVFALSRSLVLLTISAIIGTISPSGNEVGPFLSIEQASLTQIVSSHTRTRVFAWYSLVGSCATALGALCAGLIVRALGNLGRAPLDGYRLVVIIYGLLGFVLALLFARLSPAVELSPEHSMKMPGPNLFGLSRSRGIILKLSGLFMVDAFAGGLIVQSLMAYWFHLRFGAPPELLGAIFFGANLFAGISALAAARIAARIGLVNTMVWTHIPSNVLLMLVPLMPNLPLAIAVLMVRFSISQMDVPTRQSYTMAVVDPGERSAAAGVTGVARTAASAIAPLFTGQLFSATLLSIPFYIAGGLKIIYDLALYHSFHALPPPEEHK